MSMARRPLWLWATTYGTLTLTGLVILYPLAFMVLATFTTTERYYQTSFFPIPNSFDLHNYAVIVADCSQGCIWQSIMLTAARALWYIFWALLISVLGGYVFARLTFPFKNALFLFFLSGLMVPPLLTALPHYIMLARFPLVGGNDLWGQGGHGFVNEWPALGILGLVNVIGLFLVKQNSDFCGRQPRHHASCPNGPAAHLRLHAAPGGDGRGLPADLRGCDPDEYPDGAGLPGFTALLRAGSRRYWHQGLAGCCSTLPPAIGPPPASGPSGDRACLVGQRLLSCDGTH